MGTWDDRLTIDGDTQEPPRWNNFTSVHPVQFVGESAIRALPMRLACSAMSVGDPVQVTENGRIVTAGTIAARTVGTSAARSGSVIGEVHSEAQTP